MRRPHTPASSPQRHRFCSVLVTLIISYLLLLYGVLSLQNDNTPSTRTTASIASVTQDQASWQNPAILTSAATATGTTESVLPSVFLIDEEDASDIETLQRLLQHADPAQRLSAINRAAEIRAVDYEYLLISSLQDPDAAIRIRVLQGLANGQTPISLQMIEQALADQDKNVRIAALDAYRWRLGSGAIARAQTLLSDHDADVRGAAFDAITEIIDSENWPSQTLIPVNHDAVLQQRAQQWQAEIRTTTEQH